MPRTREGAQARPKRKGGNTQARQSTQIVEIRTESNHISLKEVKTASDLPSRPSRQSRTD